jgi:biotin operon repressor
MSKAGKPLKGGEIASLSGLDKSAVDKTMKELQKQGKIFSPKKCYYEIKK